MQKETAEKGTLKFMLLGSMPVTYVNPGRKDILGGSKETKYALTLEDGSVKEFDGVVPEPYSVLIRKRKIKEIKVYFD